MSLVKKPTMTEKKIAANRRNRSLSHGAVTAEGKERIAGAQLRHGFYAKAQEEALLRLGEDPAHFEELLQGLYEEFTPVGALQIELVNRLARVRWLVERTDRSLEGDVLRRARSADHGRDNRLHARMMRLKMTVETDSRYPRITAAQWEAREPVRQLLENILTHQVEFCEEQRQATLREGLAGPSPFERAAEIAPSHRNALLMRRMEDSSFRQVARITSLLLKKGGPKMQVQPRMYLKTNDIKNWSGPNSSRCQNVYDK